MDEIIDKVSHVLPPRWRETAVLIAVAAPLVGRAYHSLSNGGGLRGIYRSILFGTNTPKQNAESSNEKPQS
jgi:hypothetical protein